MTEALGDFDPTATCDACSRTAGLPDVRIDTDDDRLPLPSPDDWWRIVMGPGLRRTITAIGDDAAAEVRGRCDAYIAADDAREVVSRSRYVATRA